MRPQDKYDQSFGGLDDFYADKSSKTGPTARQQQKKERIRRVVAMLFLVCLVAGLFIYMVRIGYHFAAIAVVFLFVIALVIAREVQKGRST